MYSSGHEQALALPTIQLALTCDFLTLLYRVANLPVAANQGNLAAIPSGEFSDCTPDSGYHHLGLQDFPAAWGGEQKNSLRFFSIADSLFHDRARSLDVSKKTGRYGFIDKTEIGGISDKVGANTPVAGTYPTTAIDYKRERWWVVSCCRFQRHFVKVLDETGDGLWQREGGSAESSRLKLSSWSRTGA
jgi:hypothetical protein